jgi:hypothetical protein
LALQGHIRLETYGNWVKLVLKELFFIHLHKTYRIKLRWHNGLKHLALPPNNLSRVIDLIVIMIILLRLQPCRWSMPAARLTPIYASPTIVVALIILSH